MDWKGLLKQNWPVILVALLASMYARHGFPLPFEIRWTPSGDSPPATSPTNPTKPAPKADPVNAITKISSGGTGCSATVVGPRRPDGRWWMLSAAHCVKGAGQKWQCTFRDGRRISATVVNFDRRSDWSWLITDEVHDLLPFAYLAEATPIAGTEIWHAGFGVHVPGNVEKGTVLGKSEDRGQVRMSLSVSSGDSGGGIFRLDNGQLFSCVCCTAAKGRVADTFGSTLENLRQGRSDRVTIDQNVAPAVFPEPIGGMTDGEEESVD